MFVKNILITGANGQIGKELKDLLQGKEGLNPIFCTKEDLDIRDGEAISKLFKKHHFHYCINCAAFTAVDKAESEKDSAYEINATAVKQLANICLAKETFLIHFSSDYVYHSILDRPLLETDPTEAKSIYAKSKLAGEEYIQEVNPSYLIFRTSWVYSFYGHNFIKTMIRLGAEREELKVVNDQYGVPTYAHDIAQMVLDVIHRLDVGELNPKEISGVYNYCNTGLTNWYELAKFIMDQKGLDCQIHPIPSSEYPTAAARPTNSQLDITKFKSTFDLPIPTWQESVSKVLELL